MLGVEAEKSSLELSWGRQVEEDHMDSGQWLSRYGAMFGQRKKQESVV